MHVFLMDLIKVGHNKRKSDSSIQIIQIKTDFFWILEAS